jgi:LysR family transcriptional regulator, glycine cleavage system transcriptional activator
MAKSNGRLPPLNALRAFEAAARHMSFKKAAKELHVTAGAVSHQVKLLEDHLGMPLFRRLTRALELTPEANAMLPRVREGLDKLVSAVDLVRAREQSQTLTVMAPPNFAARWLIPRLTRFTDRHPHIELHVASRQSMVDGAENGHVPLDEAPPDTPLVMVRFGDGRYPGLQVEEVYSAVYVAVCSPKLMKGPRALKKPADLRHHTLIHDDTVTEEGARPDWADFLGLLGLLDDEAIDAARGPRFSDASLAVEAAIEGMGVTLAMKPLVSAEIEAKRLAIPFDVTAPTSYSYYLVTPGTHGENPSVTAFREWLLAEAAPERA